MSLRTTAELARLCDGVLRGADRPFAQMVIDSRAVAAGDCFVALPGSRVDGHDFVAGAAAAGAAAALVSRAVAADLSQVVVADPLAALQRFASAWRAAFELPVVGITGSNGKTTLRALCEAVLAPLGPLLATGGNLNNDIGVPLMLSRIGPGHRAAIIEMGANHIGEIAALAAMARPDVAVVTNAGDAHLEGFGSRRGVAQGKGEIFSALPPEGTAVINADDAYADYWAGLAGARRQLRFGLQAGADVRAQDIRPEPAQAPRGSRFEIRHGDDSVSAFVPLPGAHNVRNALAAVAVGLSMGLTLAEAAAGLADVVPPEGRLQWQPLPGGGQLLDDSYNANPDSLAAGVALLAASAGYRLLVLGDMAELGADAAARHFEAGAAARAAGIDALYAVGPLSAEAVRAFGPGGRHFDSCEALCEALLNEARGADAGKRVLLVKGSRSAGMERVVAALTSGGDDNHRRDSRRNDGGGADAVSPR